MRKNTWFATLATVLGLCAVPAAAAAQVCAGFPTVDGQSSLAVAGNFPKDADQFGLELSANAAGPFAVFGGFTRTTASLQDEESANTYTGGLALDVAERYLGAFPLGLSACPVASASLTDLEGADVWRVPVGVGFGGQIVLGPAESTLELMPYVVPQLVWTRVDFEEASTGSALFGSLFGAPETPDDTEETHLALRSGLMVGAGRFYFGGEFNNVLNDDVRAVLGVKAGLRF